MSQSASVVHGALLLSRLSPQYEMASPVSGSGHGALHPSQLGEQSVPGSASTGSK